MLDTTNLDSLKSPLTYALVYGYRGRYLEDIQDYMSRIENGEYGLILNADISTCIDDIIYLKYYYNALPPAERYSITIEVYRSKEGYNFLKKLIIGLKKIKPDDYLKDLPDEYKGLKEFVVYRGSDRPIEEQKTSISWTLSKERALWFRNRHRIIDGNGNLYRGIISAKDVIAYTNERQEHEIIQHNNVKNIVCLDE